MQVNCSVCLRVRFFHLQNVSSFSRDFRDVHSRIASDQLPRSLWYVSLAHRHTLVPRKTNSLFFLSLSLSVFSDLTKMRVCAVCDVDITVANEEYPKLIEIDPGTSIRWNNKVTRNNAEHTVTPLKTSNAVNYFGGLSFYATDLGGLFTPTQVICGNINCQDAFAVQRDPKSPFLTINWPEADYPFYCQFHGMTGIIRVGNGAGKEPPLPPNTDPDITLKGCCAQPSLCAQAKPRGCKDEFTVQKASGLGYCEPVDANACRAGGDGVCRWAVQGVENCQIQGKQCVDGLCVENVGTPTPFGANPCGAPCTNYPAPTCADATSLSFMSDATKAQCINVAGTFQCRYTLTVLDCTTFGAATTCANGRCVQNGNVRYTPPTVGGTPSPGGPIAPVPSPPGAVITPAPANGGGGCSSLTCAAPNECVENACTACTANCAALQAACTCGVDCTCTKASCRPCAATPAPPTPPSTQPCSNAAPTGLCAAGQRCAIVGAAYSCEVIPPCSAAERERACASAGQVCQGSNGVYQCSAPTPTCSTSSLNGRCEAAGLICATGGVCTTSGQGGSPAAKCSLANPQGACDVKTASGAATVCQTNAQGQVLCAVAPAAPGTGVPLCQITDTVCRNACVKSSVKSCSCTGVVCHPTADSGTKADTAVIVAPTATLVLLLALALIAFM